VNVPRGEILDMKILEDDEIDNEIEKCRFHLSKDDERENASRKHEQIPPLLSHSWFRKSGLLLARPP
jgi:hypothetical protein